MNEKICAYCKNPNNRKRSDFCSDNCRMNFNYKPTTNEFCLECGKLSRKSSNFCSIRCYQQHKKVKIKIENQCNYCKTIFITNRREGSFCSTKCRNAFRYEDNITNNLCVCGEVLVLNKSACENCRIKVDKWRRQNPRPIEQQILNSAKSRAKRKKLPINITIEDIVVPEFCPVLGIKLEKGKNKSQFNSPSLDRIIPELGYVKGNIAIISHKANTIKNNGNLEEIEKVLAYIKSCKT